MAGEHHKLKCETPGCTGVVGFFWEERMIAGKVERGSMARPGNDAVTCPHCGTRWELRPVRVAPLVLLSRTVAEA